MEASGIHTLASFVSVVCMVLPQGQWKAFLDKHVSAIHIRCPFPHLASPLRECAAVGLGVITILKITVLRSKDQILPPPPSGPRVNGCRTIKFNQQQTSQGNGQS